jgi:hypothetical protein
MFPAVIPTRSRRDDLTLFYVPEGVKTESLEEELLQSASIRSLSELLVIQVQYDLLFVE